MAGFDERILIYYNLLKSDELFFAIFEFFRTFAHSSTHIFTTKTLFNLTNLQNYLHLIYVAQ